MLFKIVYGNVLCIFVALSDPPLLNEMGFGCNLNLHTALKLIIHSILCYSSYTDCNVSKDLVLGICLKILDNILNQFSFAHTELIDGKHIYRVSDKSTVQRDDLKF